MKSVFNIFETTELIHWYLQKITAPW